MIISLNEAATSIRDALKQATQGLVERETLADLIVLAAVAGEHLLVLGPPGTAKSEAVRRISRAMSGNYFEYLLGRFTEPSEIFGPIDLRKLRNGTVETETTGMLPEAEVAFLDEVFLGSTAILNTLLSILNERTFRRGHTRIHCPLRVCVGASNNLPEDESLAAFADRFLIHVFLQPVPDSLLEDLLKGGWAAQQSNVGKISSLEHLNVLSQVAHQADLEPIRPHLAHCIRLLRKAGGILSDRRIVKAQKLTAAAAALAGREQPTVADLWPLLYVIPTAEGQALGRDVLNEILEASENQTLMAAAEDASQGPLARAWQILDRGETLLAQKPQEESDQAGWQLRLEALLREIDANFSEEVIPDNLKTLRNRLVEMVGEQ